jgi:hypothetical protein
MEYDALWTFTILPVACRYVNSPSLNCHKLEVTFDLAINNYYRNSFILTTHERKAVLQLVELL